MNPVLTKTGHMSIANSQDIGIDMETLPPPPRGRGHPFHNIQRSHSRSASWSLPGVQSSRSSGMSLASLNPMTPITSVIREIVPSFRQFSHRSESSGSGSPHSISRNPSQISLLIEGSELEDASEQRQGDTHHSGYESNWQDSLRTSGADPISNVHVHQTHDHIAPHPPRGVGGGGTEEQNNIGVELSDSFRWLEHNAIFIIIILIKFAWYHRSGLMVILGMFGTFIHCNQVLCNQVAKKNRRQIHILFLLVIFLAANISVLYYAYWDQQVYNCLIFLAPHFTVNVWNLIWSVWVTDYIIKFVTIAVKAVVVAMFLPILPTAKKGKYYMLLEYVSQFYRTIVPAPLWVRFLSDPSMNGTVSAVLITAVYLMIKGAVIYMSFWDLCKAVILFIKDQVYGQAPSPEDLASVSQHCAICQEDFIRPIMLSCKHIFCEDCVLQWFDRQNSCPLCRATIANQNPKWRDGSTARWPQIF